MNAISMTILILLAVIVGVPVACLVAWNLFKIFLAIISDLAGLICAFIVIAVVLGLVILL